jgi:hypothetical protein
MEFLACEDEAAWSENIVKPYIKKLSSQIKFSSLCVCENDFYTGTKGKNTIFIHKDLLRYLPIEICPNDYLLDNIISFKYVLSGPYNGDTELLCEIRDLNKLKTIINFEGRVLRYTKDYSVLAHSLISDGCESYMYEHNHLEYVPYKGEIEINNQLNGLSIKEIVAEKLFNKNNSLDVNKSKAYFGIWPLKKEKLHGKTIFVFKDKVEDFSITTFNLKLGFSENRELIIVGYSNSYIEDLIFEIFSDESTVNLFRGHLSTNDYASIFDIDECWAKTLDDYI